MLAAKPVKRILPSAIAQLVGLVGVPAIVGAGLTVITLESVLVPHSLVAAKLMVWAPKVVIETAPGFNKVALAGVPPLKLHA